MYRKYAQYTTYIITYIHLVKKDLWNTLYYMLFQVCTHLHVLHVHNVAFYVTMAFCGLTSITLVLLWDQSCNVCSPNKQVSPPSNTNTTTRQHMQSSSPMDPSTLRTPRQRVSRSASQMRSTRRATINQHPLPGKDHHHQNSAEAQTGEGCIPPSWQARPCGFGTTAFRPQQAQRTHAQETKHRSFPQRVLVVRRTRQPSTIFRDQIYYICMNAEI